MAKKKTTSVKKEKRYWFRSKLYGWGWVPVTWQGWTATLAYILFLVWNAKQIDAVSHSVSYTLIGFSPVLILATLALILLCIFTGEKPHWRWGK